MIHYSRLGLVLLGSVAAASCSGGTGHAVCKDAISTQNYGVKWQEELAAARWANKLTVEQAADVQGRMFGQLGLLKQKQWAEYCGQLDKLRSEVGF